MNRPLSRATVAAGHGSLAVLVALSIAAQALANEEQAVDTSEANEPIRICYGEHGFAAIGTTTDLDRYQFRGTEGDEVRITVRGLSWNLDLNMEVYSPTGILIDQRQCDAPTYGTCAVQSSLTIPRDGVYTILLTEWGANNAGSYVLGIDRFPPQALPTTIDYNTTITSAFDYHTDHDFFAFEGEAGTQIRILVSGLDWNVDLYLDVLDPDGDLIAGSTTTCDAPTYGTCSIYRDLTLAKTGRHHLVLNEWGFDNTGSYNVSLNCLIGLCPDSPPLAPIGAPYCTSNANSTGLPATIAAFGSEAVAENDVHLRVVDAPPGRLGYFLMGPNQVSIPFAGQGLLCVNPLRRLKLFRMCAGGSAAFSPDLADLPASTVVTPGSTLNFQAWFRDDNPMATSNTSDGVGITFN